MENIQVEAPIDEWRDVRHAIRTAINKHRNKAATARDYKRISHAKHATRLRTFLDRIPDVKYGRGGDT